MPRLITDYFLYKWRYSIAYTLVGLLVAVLLVAATFYVPGGLSQAEMASATNSSQISFSSFDPATVIDLPYSVLQYASFELFGITTFSIKLPSLILGLLSLVGIILLLRHWFHMNVAVISALIVVTTSHFIFSSQNGTPTIMYIFMPTWLLLLALKTSRQDSRKGRNFWEPLLVAAIALSLYTPLSIYVLIALTSATLLHPHLRFIVSRLSRTRLLIASVVGATVLSPLIIALLSKPEIGLTLLGIPENWPSIQSVGLQLLKTHFGFFFTENGVRLQSIYTLPSILLVILGVIHLFKTRHTARSYIITSWMLLLAPIILLHPTRTAITFVPVMLLIAAGIDELLHRWYSLFPHNPYARVAGLLPITLLVAGMALTGIERHFYTYRYSPSVVGEFTSDLRLLEAELYSLSSQTVSIVTANSEQEFYQAVASYKHGVDVLTTDDPLPSDQPFVMTRNAFYERNTDDIKPTKVITNGRSSEADRLYRYN